MMEDSGKQTILEAFTEGSFLGNPGRRFELELETAVSFCGKELAQNLLPDERAIICFPISLTANSKVQSGALLLLEDRVVLAWSEGWRVKKFSRAFALSEISNILASKKTIGSPPHESAAVTFIVHGEKFEVILDSDLYTESLASWLLRALNGEISLENYKRP